jgi:hypothetical protein
MADHLREQAIEAILAATTGLTTTGANVFRGRVESFQRTELPGGNIRSGAERIDPRSFPRPRIQERRFQVDWIIHVALATGYEEQTNLIIKEVEIALANPAVAAAFGGKAVSLLHIDAPLEVLSEVKYVQTAMNFEVWYMTSENAPDTPR